MFFHVLGVFSVLFLCFLVVSTSVVDCLERLVSEMICFCGVDIKPYSLTCVDGLVQCCSRPSVH